MKVQPETNKLSRAKIILGTMLAVIRHWVNDDVIAAIKEAAIEALTHDEWSEGEKTRFVLAAGRKVVAATPSQWDDFVYELAATLYIRKYMLKAMER